MKLHTLALLIAAVSLPLAVSASEADVLNWTSVAIQCGATPEGGDIACKITTGVEGLEKFEIQAFGKLHELTVDQLNKLKEFPLSSLSASHEAGYELTGGYSINFRFSRIFYDSEKQLISESIVVSVNKNGVNVSGKQTNKKDG